MLDMHLSRVFHVPDALPGLNRAYYRTALLIHEQCCYLMIIKFSQCKLLVDYMKKKKSRYPAALMKRNSSFLVATQKAMKSWQEQPT